MHTPSRRRISMTAATATATALLVGLVAGLLGAETADAATSTASAPEQSSQVLQLASSKKVTVPNLVGKSGKTAEKMLEKIGLRRKWVPPADEYVIVASHWRVTSQGTKPGTTVKVGKKIKLTVVKKESSASGSKPAENTTPTFAPLSFSGSGDNVQALNLDQPAILTFSCPSCSDNTTLESNGPDSLIVNTIGAYTGSHLINTSDGGLTTKLTVGADAPWTLSVSDLTSAKSVDGAASGSGDQVIHMTGTFSDVALRNEGADNFVVQSYDNGDWDPLVANEIGAYSGTVPMSGPTYVDVESSGNWSITPAD
jgi:hypothetical protein